MKWFKLLLYSFFAFLLLVGSWPQFYQLMMIALGPSAVDIIPNPILWPLFFLFGCYFLLKITLATINTQAYPNKQTAYPKAKSLKIYYLFWIIFLAFSTLKLYQITEAKKPGQTSNQISSGLAERELFNTMTAFREILGLHSNHQGKFGFAKADQAQRLFEHHILPLGKSKFRNHGLYLDYQLVFKEGEGPVTETQTKNYLPGTIIFVRQPGGGKFWLTGVGLGGYPFGSGQILLYSHQRPVVMEP